LGHLFQSSQQVLHREELHQTDLMAAVVVVVG
jgi:hypothetical protein